MKPNFHPQDNAQEAVGGRPQGPNCFSKAAISRQEPGLFRADPHVPFFCNKEGQTLKAFQGPTDSRKEAVTPRLLSTLSSVSDLAWDIYRSILYAGQIFVVERFGPTYFSIGFFFFLYLGSNNLAVFFLWARPFATVGSNVCESGMRRNGWRHAYLFRHIGGSFWPEIHKFPWDGCIMVC